MKKKLYKLLILLLGLQLGGTAAAPAMAETTTQDSSTTSSQVVKNQQLTDQASGLQESLSRASSSESSPAANEAEASSKTKAAKAKAVKEKAKAESDSTKADDDDTDSNAAGTLTWGSIENSKGPFNYGTFGSQYMEKTAPTNLDGINQINTIADNYNFGPSGSPELRTLYGDFLDKSTSITSDNYPPLPLLAVANYANKTNGKNKWETQLEKAKVSDLQYSSDGSGTGAIVHRSGVLDYQAGSNDMKFKFELTMTPTIFHNVNVHWQWTNESGGERNVFFMKMLDTALNTGGDYDYEDNVPIYYLGDNQGLYIKNGDSTDPYRFEVFTNVANGPDGLRASSRQDSNGGGLRYPLIQSQIPADTNQTLFKTFNDPGQIVDNGAADTEAQGAPESANPDTTLNLLWFPREMADGDTADLEYNVHASPETAKPTLKVEQSPQVYYKADTDQKLNGTLTDADNQGKAEKIYYRVNTGSSVGEWKLGKSLTNTTQGKANDFNFTVPKDEIKAGNTIEVQAVDIDGGLSGVESVKLVQATGGFASFDKQVRDVTKNADADFTTETDASPGDKLEYQIKLDTGSQGIKKGSEATTVKDDFDDDLNIKDGAEVKIGVTPPSGGTRNYSADYDKNNHTITIPDEALTMGIDENTTVTLTYTATLDKDTEQDKIDNYAVLTATSALDGTTVKAQAGPATVNVLNKGTITVKYLDRANNKEISSDSNYEGKIGESPKIEQGNTTTSTIQPPTFNDLVVDGQKQDYTVYDSYSGNTESMGDIGDLEWTEPAVDYNLKFTKEPQTVIYRYEKSRIAINQVPTKWEFGEFTTTPSAMTFFLRDPTENQRQIVVDDFYTAQNWKLTVKQESQFKGTTVDENGNTVEHELTGAMLKLNHGNVNVDGSLGDDFKLNQNSTVDITPGAEAATLMEVKSASNDTDQPKYANHGKGTYTYQFGDDKTKNTSIGLYIPESTKRYETSYETTLNWTLEYTE
uniref:WxL domain-containing protein n=1 Tax=Loigolactobacillus rennini TaxID=238013 RepID=A0A1K2I763_9LACO|nr:Putative uncharacterized protein [Loigolactobacillus rennini]